MKSNTAIRREKKRLARLARLSARRRADGVPPGLIEAIAGDGFEVVQLGPHQFEFIAKESGEVVRPAA